MIVVKAKMFRTLVTVPEAWRALVLVNGQYHAILRPGRHSLASFGRIVTVEGHSLAQKLFMGAHEQTLSAARPDLAQAHLTDVRTSGSEVAVVTCDGKLHSVLKPEQRQLYWTEAGPWSVEKIDVAERLDIGEKLATRLVALGATDRVKRFNVEEGQVGLLYIDNAFTRVLAAGAHAFWNVGRALAVKIVDTRQTALDVTGQEVQVLDIVSKAQAQAWLDSYGTPEP